MRVCGRAGMRACGRSPPHSRVPHLVRAVIRARHEHRLLQPVDSRRSSAGAFRGFGHTSAHAAARALPATHPFHDSTFTSSSCASTDCTTLRARQSQALTVRSTDEDTNSCGPGGGGRQCGSGWRRWWRGAPPRVRGSTAGPPPTRHARAASPTRPTACPRCHACPTPQCCRCSRQWPACAPRKHAAKGEVGGCMRRALLAHACAACERAGTHRPTRTGDQASANPSVGWPTYVCSGPVCIGTGAPRGSITAWICPPRFHSATAPLRRSAPSASPARVSDHTATMCGCCGKHCGAAQGWHAHE